MAQTPKTPVSGYRPAPDGRSDRQIDAVMSPIDPAILARVGLGSYRVGEVKAGIGETRTIIAMPENPWFGPGQPMQPSAPPEAAGRAWDYPFTTNMNVRPRANEPITFEMLRAYADNYDLLRLVIESRKDQFMKLTWNIQRKLEAGQDTRSDPDDRCRKVERFFAKPDGINNWSTWLRMLLEDMFVIDAATVYLRRTIGGDPYSAEVVDGATIKVLVDYHGRAPAPPSPAYQQVLKGLPATDYTVNDMIYAPRNQRVAKLYGYCYDAETEILTKDRGWVRFGDLADSDLVATRSKDAVFEWQKPSRIVREQWNGEMIHFTSKSMDLLVTPEHRMLVDAMPRALGGGPTRGPGDAIITAAQLEEHNNHELKIPMTSTWVGEEIGEQTIWDRKNHPRSIPLILAGDDFCALMGAYLSSGNIRSQGGIEINIQRDRPDFAKFEALIRRLGGTLGKRAAILSRRAITAYFRQFGLGHEKFVPAEIMNATPRQIGIFLDYYLIGDGNYEERSNLSGRGDQPKHSVAATTTSRRLADQLVELAQKTGASASLCTKPAADVVLFGAPTTCCASHRVRWRYSKAMSVTAARVQYTGPIYCVTVPNGIVYVRRNGMPAWSGNSPVEQLVMMINIALRREIFVLAYYTQGNMPDSIIGTPETWGVEEVKQFQKYWDSVHEGNSAQRRHARFTPGKVDVQFTRDPTLKDDFDEWIARMIAYCFSVSPLPLVRMMNRSTAQSAQDQAMEEGLLPVMAWVKELIDTIIVRLFGYTDIEFIWDDHDKPKGKEGAEIYKTQVDNGVMSLDAWRAEVGQDPIGVPAIVKGLGPAGFVYAEHLGDPDVIKAAKQGLIAALTAMAAPPAGLPVGAPGAPPVGMPAAAPGGPQAITASGAPPGAGDGLEANGQPSGGPLDGVDPEILAAVGLGPDDGASPGATSKFAGLPASLLASVGLGKADGFDVIEDGR